MRVSLAADSTVSLLQTSPFELGLLLGRGCAARCQFPHSMVIAEPAAAGAQLSRELWGDLVSIEAKDCHGANRGPKKPISTTTVTLWKLRRSERQAYFEQGHCPPLP